MYAHIELKIPDSSIILRPGNKIRIGRFSDICWEVGYGWFKFDNNREICGWFLIDPVTNTLKPLTDADIVDIYLLEC